jgi:tetratricopeptide (TPR) repeat protein
LKSLYSDLSSALSTSGVDIGEEISVDNSQLAEKEVLPLARMLSEMTTDTVIIFLNIASLSYQHRQYGNCRQILEKLLEFLTIEPFDTGISLKVCFLLIEVMLYQWNNGNGYHTEEELNSFQSQSLLVLTAADKYVSLSLNEDENSLKGNESTDIQIVNGTYLIARYPDAMDLKDLLVGILEYRIKLYLCRVNIALGLYKEAQNNLDIAFMAYDLLLRPIVDNIDESIVLTDAQNMSTSFRYLASYFGLMSLDLPLHRKILPRMLQKQKKISLFLQGELAYRRGDLELAQYTIKTASEEDCTSGYDDQHYNNLGCLSMKVEKFHAACMFYQKAVDEVQRTQEKGHLEEAEIRLGIILYSGSLPPQPSVNVLYNTAVSLLMSGNPLGAFLHFEQTVSKYGTRPILWIRMAECCIQCHDKQQEGHSVSKYDKNSRNLIIDTYDHTYEGKFQNSSDVCSIYKALQYLRNAIYLTKSLRVKFGGELENNQIAQQKLDVLESSALLQLSYVHLTLNSSVCALSAAMEVLSEPRFQETGIQTKYLAETYACEALCSLGRMEEAIVLLQPQLDKPHPSILNSKNIPNHWNLNLKTSKNETNYEYIISSYNIASTYILQGLLYEAQILLESVLENISTFAPAIKMLAYILLRKGKTSEALKILKYITFDDE